MYKLVINKKWLPSIRGLIGGGLMGLTLILFAYYYRPATTLVTVDITGMVKSFVKETAKQNLTMEQKQERVNQFGRAMQYVMLNIAKRQHIIILPSEAVIAGSKDYTLEVMTEIKKEMKP